MDRFCIVKLLVNKLRVLPVGTKDLQGEECRKPATRGIGMLLPGRAVEFIASFDDDVHNISLFINTRQVNHLAYIIYDKKSVFKDAMP